MKVGFVFILTEEIMFQVISRKKLSRTNTYVKNELDTLGLWTKGMNKVDVYPLPVGWHHGYFTDKFSETGEIYIPIIPLTSFLDEPMSVRDLLRHEWGHAYAHHNRRRIDTKGFKKAFGAKHDKDVEWEYECHEDDFVTEYAATSPMEDFAETFFMFCKYGGALPKQWEDAEGVQSKWKFVENLAA